jgi:bacterioferritin
MSDKESDFLLDIRALREQARQHIENGAVTEDYGGDVDLAVEILNTALATEIVCVLRYKFHAVCAQGINSESVRGEFAQHALEEQAHADRIAERISELGGRPNFSPKGMLDRAHSQYVEGETLVEMIKEDLIAERIAIDSYREMIRYFEARDPTTRRMMEEILAKEEEHATDMHDLLVAHQGNPMLPH